ncbi:hypothetical protein LPJ56_001597, partial [Coemansia sp. RSA 2599]
MLLQRYGARILPSPAHRVSAVASRHLSSGGTDPVGGTACARSKKLGILMMNMGGPRTQNDVE